MAPILQTSFSDTFLMKKYEYLLKYHWNMFTWPNMQRATIGLDNVLAPNRLQGIILFDDGIV